jgi:hypothetical protein
MITVLRNDPVDRNRKQPNSVKADTAAAIQNGLWSHGLRYIVSHRNLVCNHRTFQSMQCSVTCGVGLRTRQVTCRIPHLGVPSALCAVDIKPPTSMACYKQTCLKCTEEDICGVLQRDSVERWCRTPLRNYCKCGCRHVKL